MSEYIDKINTRDYVNALIKDIKEFDVDRFLNFAVKEFEKWQENTLNIPIEEEEVLYEIKDPEIIKQIRSYHKAKIVETATAKMAKIAEERTKLQYATLIQLIIERIIIDPDQKFRVDTHRLLILKDIEDEILQRLFDTAKQIVFDADEKFLLALKEHKIPVEIVQFSKRIDGIERFFVDLAETLLENREIREFLKAICTDSDLAKRVSQDADMSSPIRTLARLALRYVKTYDS